MISGSDMAYSFTTSGESRCELLEINSCPGLVHSNLSAMMDPHTPYSIVLEAGIFNEENDMKDDEVIAVLFDKNIQNVLGYAYTIANIY